MLQSSQVLPPWVRSMLAWAKCLVVIGGVVLLALIVVPGGRALVVEAGRNIPQTDVELDYPPRLSLGGGIVSQPNLVAG